MMEWYKQLEFESEYYPPGFAILRRDEIEIFLQQQPAYVAPDDSGRRKRQAWNVYIITDNRYSEAGWYPQLSAKRSNTALRVISVNHDLPEPSTVLVGRNPEGMEASKVTRSILKWKYPVTRNRFVQ